MKLEHITMRKNIFTLAILCGFMIISCKQKKEEEVKVVSEIPKEELITFVELTKEQFQVLDVKFGKIEQQNLSTTIRANGHLEVPPQNKAQVSSLVGAVVKRILVLEGSKVYKGQVLATLENLDFIRLQEDYISAMTNLSFLSKEFQRQKELAAQDAGTGKVYQRVESEYNLGKSKLASLASQLRVFAVNMKQLELGKITPTMTLRSPISGYVGKINANTGGFAEPNMVLFEVLDNSQIHCDLLVYEKDIFKVKVGQKIHFMITNMPDHTGEHGDTPIEGEIFGINKSFEGNSKTISVHARIKNENHALIPGMYVNALIDVGQKKTTVVPSEAVFTTDGKQFVFVRNKMTDCKTHKLCKEHELCAPSEDCKEHPDCEKHEHSPLANACTKHKDCEAHEKCKEVQSADAFYFTMKEVKKGVSELGFTEVAFIDEVPADAMVVTKGAFNLLSKSKTSGPMDACGH